MAKPMTLLELRDAIAKAIADEVGHGMREKCERQADAVLKVVAPQLLATADDATLRQQAGRVDEGLVDELRAEAKLHYGSNTANDTADLLIRAAAALAQNTQADGEAVAFPMTEQQVRQWIDACNSEKARQVLRDYLRLRAIHAERARVPDNFGERIKLAIEHGDAHGWQTARNELLGVLGSDYFAAPSQRAEVK